MGREGDLHITKECSAYQGRAGDFCTVTSSSLEEITVGSKIIYEDAAEGGSLDTDILLDAGSGNTASGHVKLDLSAATGELTFSGGTGNLTGFQARVDVSADPAGAWHWDGTYRFS
jgi:hypothetical protein